LREENEKDWGDWSWQLENSLSGKAGLLQLCDSYSSMTDVISQYPFRVSPYYYSLADMQNPGDPIAKQFLPDAGELIQSPGDEKDPYHEDSTTPIPGVVQRYPDRVLVMVNTQCAVRCRHCTRKNTLAAGLPDVRERWPSTLAFLKSSSSVREVIFSGGDPLLCDSETLDRILGEAASVPHVEVLRIGTRVPAVLPMRLDDDTCEMLASHRPVWVNTQFNHPSELTSEAMEACDRLVSRGIPVSNQCVLIKGVNDEVRTLVELCNGLQSNLIRPYYAFLCDPVAGISHLRTTEQEARKLASELRQQVSGLAMPLFVADVPRAGCKVPI